jgi:hypothetical protein
VPSISARGTACALACLLALVAVGGCKNAYRRELVVVFAPEATPEMHAAALKACTGAAPHTSPEPISSSTTAASRLSDVRFRIDHANDHDIAQLETCLGKQPGVKGFQDTASNS